MRCKILSSANYPDHNCSSIMMRPMWEASLAVVTEAGLIAIKVCDSIKGGKMIDN